jgi:hypothetical protein
VGTHRGPAADRGRAGQGRRLLEAMPYPDNLDHHFVVDPTKFDFYAMDCYRHLAEDRLAETLATEVIQASTDFDGTECAPMRLAKARITRGVVAARQGDLEQAIHYGERALTASRKSLPSLLMVSRDLARVLNDQYQNEPETQAYLDQLHALSSLKDSWSGQVRPANSWTPDTEDVSVRRSAAPAASAQGRTLSDQRSASPLASGPDKIAKPIIRDSITPCDSLALRRQAL